MATKNLDYQIRWLTDQSSLNKTVQDAKRLETVVDTGFDQLVNSARRGELSIDELRLALRQVGSEEDEIDKITASLKEADAAAKQLASDTEGGLITASGRSLLRGEREESRFQSFALGTFGDIPGIGGSEAFGAASGVFQLVDALPNLDFAAKSVVASIKENIAQIGLPGVGLIGGLGLVAIGFKLLTDEANKNYEATIKLLDAQAQYFRLIQTGTTQTIAEQRAALEDQLSAARGNRDLLQAQSDAVNAALRERFGDGQILNEVAISFGLIGGEVKGLRGELTDANAEVAGLEKQLRDLGVASNSAEVAANSLAAAQKAYSDFLADQRVQTANNILAVDQMTAAERRLREERVRRDLELLQNQFNDLSLPAASRLALGVQFNALNNELMILANVTDTYADQLEREKAAKEAIEEADEQRIQAITDQTDAYFDALQEEGEIRDKISAINQKIADIQSETAQKVLQIEAEREERIAQITAEHTDKIGDITAEGEEKRRDIIADSAAKIEKIQRDSGRKIQNAIAARDALAAFQAALEANQQIQDEKDAAGKALLEQDKAQAKALDSQKKSYDKAIQAQNAAADKSIRAAQDAANRALQTQYAYLNAEQVALQNQQIALFNIALYGSSGQRIIHDQMWQDLNAIAVTWAANTVNSLQGIFGAVFGGGGSGGSSGNGFLGPNGVGFGASQQQFNRNFDRRYNETLTAGRELIA